MAGSTAKDLAQLIQQLQGKRNEHQQKIEEIDRVFATYGITPAGAAPALAVGKRGRGRPKGSVKAARPVVAAAEGAAPKKRGRPKGSGKAAAPKAVAAPAAAPARKGRPSKGGVSGNDSIVNFVKSKGSARSKEIQEQWLAEGRKGNVFNIIGKLVRGGRLHKENIKGEMGSIYRIP